MIDIAPWDGLLQTYVNERGQVDYARWQQESVRELDQWLVSLGQVDLRTLEPEVAIALLINLYNALTIRQVLHYYPIASIRPDILGVPNWLALLWFFSKPVYRLNGKALSLNRIEHRMLRRQFQEPRIHFALVCASAGCPLLRSGAYQPDRLNSQLDEDTDQFINNPDKVRYDAARQVLYCSPIFKWYRTDFLAEADSIGAYINRYFRHAELPPDTPLIYLPYSWTLNSTVYRASH